MKSKQYDKALRALELLELSDPKSTKTPTVRILEGNLRIRKAQMIRQAQIDGTVDADETSDPATEYDKAAKIFTETHDQYMPSYLALSQMVDGSARSGVVHRADRRPQRARVPDSRADPRGGRAVAARASPRSSAFVGVETDLGDIQSNLDQAEAIDRAPRTRCSRAKDHS